MSLQAADPRSLFYWKPTTCERTGVGGFRLRIPADQVRYVLATQPAPEMGAFARYLERGLGLRTRPFRGIIDMGAQA